MSSLNPILITGCAGFIGSAFARRWKQEFPKVPMIGVDDFSTGRRDAILKEMTFCEGSITDDAFLNGILKKYRPDVVFHFAAVPRVGYSVEHPFRTLQSNLSGTVLLLEKARDFEVKRCIYSSSCAVYGASVERPHTENEAPVDPISPYGLEKYVGERYCVLLSKLFGLDTVCLRYFNVFGPGQYGDSPYSGVISAWLSGACSRSVEPNSMDHSKENREKATRRPKKLFLEGDGRQSRDFCFVDNVIDANLLAFQSEQRFHGDVFNIGSGEEIDLLTLKHLIEQYTGNELVLEKRPSRLGDIQQSQADITKAGEVLGYVPRVNFEEGLQRTIQWVKWGCRQEDL